MRKQLGLFIYVVPALIVYAALFLYPLLQSFQYSVYRWDGIGEKTWIGLRNFEVLFGDITFRKALQNNLVYTAVVLVFQTAIALGLALLLYRPRRGVTFFRVVFFLPAVFSIVSIGFTWSFIYDPNYGALNTLLGWIGFSSPPLWLGTQGLALYAVAVVNIWQFAGYAMLIFIAGLQAIPDDLYESSSLEGATKWQTFRNITLPLLTPSTAIVVMLTLVGSFKVFELIYVMTAGGPFSSTKVLAYSIYEQAFSYNAVGYASSISVVLFAVVAVLSFVQIKFFRANEA